MNVQSRKIAFQDTVETDVGHQYGYDYHTGHASFTRLKDKIFDYLVFRPCLPAQNTYPGEEQLGKWENSAETKGENVYDDGIILAGFSQDPLSILHDGFCFEKKHLVLRNLNSGLEWRYLYLSSRPGKLK